MKLKLRNPIPGSLDPIPVTKRVWKFVLTGTAMLFMHIYSQTFNSVVKHNTGYADPQALPERPRKTASRLCMASTAFLFLAIGLAFAKSYHAIWSILLAVFLCAQSGRVLRQNAWGLQNAFYERRRHMAEAMRRLVQVIRHGRP
jgi:hypothetical protein